MNGRGDNTTGKELERKNRARRSGKGNGRFGSILLKKAWH
jgi:hypothetical protein